MNSPGDIATDYRQLLEQGWIEKWELHNLSESDCEPWWSALEQLASSDGLRVERGWSNRGAGSYFLPNLSIVQRGGPSTELTS